MLLHHLFALLPLASLARADQSCASYVSSLANDDGDASCPSTHIIDIRGTKEPQGPSAQKCIINRLVATLPGADACALVYPAEASRLNPHIYAKSEDTGVDALNGHLVNYTQTCPTTSIVLMGYSQVRTLAPYCHREGLALNDVFAGSPRHRRLAMWTKSERCLQITGPSAGQVL